VNQVVQAFKWRQKGGEFIYPSKMKTRHLFHTLRMIWNHKMPECAKITPYNQYEFSAYYTDEYLKKSIFHLSQELGKRNDMTSIQKYELGQMVAYLSRNQLALKVNCIAG